MMVLLAAYRVNGRGFADVPFRFGRTEMLAPVSIKNDNLELLSVTNRRYDFVPTTLGSASANVFASFPMFLHC